MQDAPMTYPTSITSHKRKVYLTKEFTFDSAHRLCQHKGKCVNLHGHTYRLIVTVSGLVTVPRVGENVDLHNLMVVDFTTLSGLVKEEIIETHDHKFLNDIYGDNPTAELMCIGIFHKLESQLYDNIKLEKIVLYETPTSYAEYRGGL